MRSVNIRQKVGLINRFHCQVFVHIYSSKPYGLFLLYIFIWQIKPLSVDVFRPVSSSNPVCTESHKHHGGSGRSADGLSQLDPSGGVRRPRPPLQSLLDLECPGKITGAFQEKEEKDHRRGNWCFLPSPPRGFHCVNLWNLSFVKHTHKPFITD